jgi:hypothetical protein
MTHYTVMVIGHDVERILAPYDENLEIEPYIDRTKDEIHKTFIKQYGKYRAGNKPESELDTFEKLTLSLETENAKWVKQWCGQDLDKDGNTLSTYNPDSKWDWYEIGGRWTGTFILKTGEVGELGEPSWTNENESIPDGHADQAYKGQIDWDAMNNGAKEQAAKDWDDLFNLSPDKCWFRPEYIEKQRKLHLDMYGTKEEYIKRRGVWTPYAVVTEDGWHAPGDMGWWGMSSDETEDRDKFDAEFKKLFTKYDDDTLITMVDCHI